jgi:ABC-type branched-subunit amino acid transport system ATPase component
MLLELKGLTKHFGGLAAVSQFDLVVNEEEIVFIRGQACWLSILIRPLIV